MPLDIVGFVRKWNASTLTERSAAQQHFRDLCEALGVPHPTEADEIGASYTFEKSVTKAGTGEQGYADVWKRGFFAWEYKSKGGDLKAAYKQLNEYHEALENPPLLVVCDFVRFEVHTKFENSPSRVYKFTLDDLLVPQDTPDSAVPPLEVLRHVFGDYNQLRPTVVSARITEAAAKDFLKLAQRLELERAGDPNRPSKEAIAHFLMRMVFCLFADSVGLLPNHTFRRLVENDRRSPSSFNRKLPFLFEAMSGQGGFFGVDNIRYFNGGLFSDNSTIPLDQADMGILYNASRHDWSHIEPAIFGTLFERSLDEAKRSIIGAHYTSTEDILLLIEPVVMRPLRRRWEQVKASVLAALEKEKAEVAKKTRAPRLGLNRPALQLLQDWATELTRVTVLDPACGSGNFLYVALKRLLDLWHEARVFGVEHGLTITLDPIPNPAQLFGIETDFYAHEIASIVVWIGFLQWKHDHGVKDEEEPLLRKLENIEKGDAILRYDEEGNPYKPQWPAVDYIVGNPPFLGDKKMRAELNSEQHPHYVDDLRLLYEERVPGAADLVTYWFERSRMQIASKKAERVGLIATQAIRGGANRQVLDGIVKDCEIFWAHSDREWSLNGATVHISLVAFGGNSDVQKELDGIAVQQIHSNLTAGVELTKAQRLSENAGKSYIGTQKGGPFELDRNEALRMIALPSNPNNSSNKQVIKPWVNALDLVRRPREMYIIDFGVKTQAAQAALFEAPFEHVKQYVYPGRITNSRATRREKWWLFDEPMPAMRKALAALSRYIATPRVAKHRIFVWLTADTIPDSAICVFASDDDYVFGVLHSYTHELWSLKTGTQLREIETGFRYTPKFCFDTFPFPWPPGKEPKDDPRVEAIAEAARNLVELRDKWLNPPDTPESELKKRTLTNLYNARPQWLADAHRALDLAVFAAYGWPSDLTDQQILGKLLELNHQRAAQQ